MHHDCVTSLVGVALRQRCIEAVIEEGELVGHLGTVHRWATAIVDGGPAAEALLRGR
jgi:hypothetical protein